MRSIFVLSLGLTLGASFAVEAQPLPGGTTLPSAPGVAQSSKGRQGAASAPLLADPAASAPIPRGFDPPGQKPPRPDNAVGPDLLAYVFAPRSEEWWGPSPRSFMCSMRLLHRSTRYCFR